MREFSFSSAFVSQSTSQALELLSLFLGSPEYQGMSHRPPLGWGRGAGSCWAPQPASLSLITKCLQTGWGSKVTKQTKPLFDRSCVFLTASLIYCALHHNHTKAGSTPASAYRNHTSVLPTQPQASFQGHGQPP